MSDNAFPECITIDTTYRCNLKCKMCHQASAGYKLPENPDVSLALIERMLPILKKTKGLFFLGAGEPLMHPEFLKILKLVKESAPDLEVSFTTNGTLIDQSISQKLIDLKIGTIMISTDGFKVERGHQGAEKTFKNLEVLARLKKHNHSKYPKIGLGFVVGLDNIDELMEVLKRGTEVGVEIAVIEPLRVVSANNSWNEYISQNSIYNDLERVKSEFEKVKEYAKQHGIEIKTPYLSKEVSARRQPCRQPFSFMKVTMDGKVYMCPQGYDSGHNLFNSKAEDVWNSEAYKNLRQRLAAEDYDSFCYHCPLVQPVFISEKDFLDHLKLLSQDDLIREMSIARRYIKKVEGELAISIQSASKNHAEGDERMSGLIKKNWYKKLKNIILRRNF